MSSQPVANFKVVYIDSRGRDCSIEQRVIAEAGGELVIASCASDDEVVATAADADGILNGMYVMNRALLGRLPNVKVIARGGVGFDNIDIDAATACGIVVCNVVDYGYNEVANHAFAMLLALNRKIVPLDRAVHQGTPVDPALQALTGRVAGETLGLLSFGNIAQAVARRAQGFDMRVIAYDPYVDIEKARAVGVELVALDDLLRASDYVSVHTPLSNETRDLIGARELALMKPTAYLVITSRGGVVSESALVDALREKRLAGAGIDVWDVEPVRPDNPLLQLDNVIGSPHFAWYSTVSAVVLKQRHAEAVADALRGIHPRSVVNPGVRAKVTLGPRPAD